MDAPSKAPSPTLPGRLGLDPKALAVDDLTRACSWAELDDRVARLRGVFADLGLQPGDHAAMVMGNRVEFVELVLAALTSGLWLTPVNWHAHPDEISYVLADSGASVVFVDPDHLVVTGHAAADRMIIEVGNELDHMLAARTPLPLDLSASPGANMIYTSGTTGRAKVSGADANRTSIVSSTPCAGPGPCSASTAAARISSPDRSTTQLRWASRSWICSTAPRWSSCRPSTRRARSS